MYLLWRNLFLRCYSAHPNTSYSLEIFFSKVLSVAWTKRSAFTSFSTTHFHSIDKTRVGERLSGICLCRSLQPICVIMHGIHDWPLECNTLLWVDVDNASDLLPEFHSDLDVVKKDAAQGLYFFSVLLLFGFS